MLVEYSTLPQMKYSYWLLWYNESENDWAVLQSNIHMVEQKYGEFDLGEIKENEKGKLLITYIQIMVLLCLTI